MMATRSFVYIEDDPRSRQVMELLMTRAMRVRSLTTFEDSDDIVARIKALPHLPDVILLDIQIGPFDGFEVLHMLREDAVLRETRVIALTASVMNEEVERLRAVGFDGAISKPLSVALFPSLMARVLDGETVWHIA